MNKSIVIYFSQTGNTKKIAQSIHAGMQGISEKCDLARMQDVTARDLLEYDLIGIGSPVWHRREPTNVLNFIEYTMNSLDGKQAFVFCTHGLFPGHFFARIVPALTTEGLIVIGWKNWYASCWVPEHPKPYFTDGHPDAIDLEEARSFGREMLEVSGKIAGGEKELLPTLPTGKAYHGLYPGPGSTDRASSTHSLQGKVTIPTRELIDLRSFHFEINKDKCLYPKCTVCIDNCPTHSINFSVSPPIFRTNCDRCWFCEQICPRGAIEVDWEPIAKFVDENITDNWFTVADTAVAKGKLRRLVDPEDIGRKTYWYTRKKPRLKLP
jgi:Fe-S-cluster-containing hydrogenase component 2